MSLPLYIGFDSSLTGYQFEATASWIPTLNISYHVGVDGLSVLVEQTALALEAWSGIMADRGAMREAAEEYLGI